MFGFQIYSRGRLWITEPNSFRALSVSGQMIRTWTLTSCWKELLELGRTPQTDVSLNPTVIKNDLRVVSLVTGDPDQLRST